LYLSPRLDWRSNQGVYTECDTIVLGYEDDQDRPELGWSGCDDDPRLAIQTEGGVGTLTRRVPSAFPAPSHLSLTSHMLPTWTQLTVRHDQRKTGVKDLVEGGNEVVVMLTYSRSLRVTPHSWPPSTEGRLRRPIC